LGASAPTIVSLPTANFLTPVAIAMGIAFPIAGYAMKHWLADFAYRINLD
jgi:putative ABC transport system permease protein